MMCIRLFVTSLFSFLYLMLSGQEGYTEKYCLDFRSEDPHILNWVGDPVSPLLMIQDTVAFNGKCPMKIFRLAIGGKVLSEIDGSFNQIIPLPDQPFREAGILLTLKTLNLSEVELTVSVYSEKEELLSTTNRSVLSEGFWMTFPLKVAISNARLISISLKFKGNDSDSEQYALLDRLSILLDGKPIDQFSPPVFVLSDSSKLNKSVEKFCPRAFDCRSTILGLGETVHGNSSLNEIGCQIIKDQVNKGICKLILWELGLEQMLQFNRYVHGYHHVSIDSLVRSIENSFYSPKHFKELLSFLRDYNQKSLDSPVSLLGFDYYANVFAQKTYLGDFLNSTNREMRNDRIESMCAWLQDRDSKQASKPLFPIYTDVSEVLTPSEFKLVAKSWETISIDGSYKERYGKRDSIMSVYVRLSQNLFATSKQTILYGHFGHTNYISQAPVYLSLKPMGYYLREAYGGDYSNIALTVNEGSFFTRYDYIQKGNKPLQKGIRGSLEDHFSQTDQDVVFVTKEQIPDWLTYCRFIGNTYVPNQFQLINPLSRMDGLIVLKRGTCIVEDRITKRL